MNQTALGLVAVLVVSGLGATTGWLGAMGGALTLMGFAVLLAAYRAAERSRGPHGELEAQEDRSEGARSVFYGLESYVALAVVLRLVLVLVVNGSSLWLAFGRDSMTWERLGAVAVAKLQDPTLFLEPGTERILAQSFYVWLNGLSTFLFGSARYPNSLLNVFVGLGSAWVTARLALDIYGTKAARRTFLVLLFYPSLCLWSVMNIREVWAHLAIGTTLLLAHQARSRVAPVSALLLLGSLLGIYLIRPYLLPIVGASICISFAVVRVRQIPAASLALALLLLAATFYGPRFGISAELLSDRKLEDIQYLRESLAYGGSAYGSGVDTTTLLGSLLYLPQGVLRFLFAPYPWNIRSWQQLIAAPESLVFVWLSVLAVRQILLDVWRRPSDVALPALTAIFIACAYGLVSGNEGTAFRHRAQVTTIVIMFSSAFQTSRRSTGAGTDTGQGQLSQEPSPTPIG